MRQSKYKLRGGPNDFKVTEVLDVPLDPLGKHSVFKLEKWDMDTLSALKLIAKELRIPLGDIGYCGLKDRHSVATQFITVPLRSNLPKLIEQKSFSLKHVGEASRPLRLGDNSANGFEIVIRELSEKVLASTSERIKVLSGASIPNYFDSQRFTFHLSPPDDLVTHITKGDWQGGLKAYLFPFRKERRQVKEAKRAMLANWGRWDECASLLQYAPSGMSKLAQTLARTGGDFERAVLSMPSSDLDMELAAHQSYLWNKALGGIVAKSVPPRYKLSVKYQAGEMLLYDAAKAKGCLDGLAQCQMGLADLKVDGPGNHPTHNVAPTDYSALEKSGLKPNRSKRPLVFYVKDAKLIESGGDGGKKDGWAKVAFTLPAGSYATIVVKMLTGY